MTDDGQAQNSCSNLAGQKGHGRDRGSYLPRFQRVKVLQCQNFVGPALSLECVFKTLEKLGSHERISLSRSIKNFLVSIYIHTSLNLPQ